MSKEMGEQINKVKNFGQFLNENVNDKVINNLEYLINDVFDNYDLNDIDNKLMFVYFKQIKHYYLISCNYDIDEKVNLCGKLHLLDGKLEHSTKDIFNIYNDKKSFVRNSIFFFDNYIIDKHKWCNNNTYS